MDHDRNKYNSVPGKYNISIYSYVVLIYLSRNNDIITLLFNAFINNTHNEPRKRNIMFNF